jgi:hypothetical protein
MSLTLFSCETTTAAIFGSIRSTPGARLIPNEGADHVSVWWGRKGWAASAPMRNTHLPWACLHPCQRQPFDRIEEQGHH